MQPGITIAQYHVIERIGVGGMGEVFRARDERLGREVAIKSVPQEVLDDPKALARFRHEARVLASVSHPNIAAIYGLEEEDGRPLLVMELVAGQTLAERLRHGPLPASEVLLIALQIARALAAAHALGAIHRDLKPANVMVGPGGVCKVLDFGLAKTANPDATSGPSGLTSAGTILGTAPYMSPEQVRGHDVDGRTDIWSFGVLLFESLTGRNPFRGDTSADTIGAILNLDPDPAELPAGLPWEALELIGRCLVKRREDRLADFKEALVLLDGVGQGSARAPGTRSAWSRTPTPRPSHNTMQAPEPQSGSGAVLRTLVVSDLVGSTSLVEKLGDQRAAQMMARHDQATRDLLAARGGREIDKTDGFLLLFERPIQGVLYALDYHRVLRDLSDEEGVDVRARVGIHLGEVILRSNSADAVSLGAKPLEVEGLAKPTAARLMSAGLGGQTLLTRGAYDLALRGSVGEPDAQGLQWLYHGAYQFYGVDAAVDVFEVGRPDTAPLTPPPDTSKARRTITSQPSSTMSLRTPAPQVASRRRWTWGAALACLALIAVGAFTWWSGSRPAATEVPAELFQIRSIVALPGEVLGSPEDAHLGEAVSRSLSGRLAKVPNLVVKAPPSAAALESTGTTPTRIAEAYAVDAMVTSLVQTVGDGLVIEVHIVAIANQDLLWSESFEGGRAEWNDLLRRVAAGAGQAILTARGNAARVEFSIPDGDASSAVEMELGRAEYLFNKYNHQHRPEDFEAARSAYEALWAADPTLVEVANNLAYLYEFRHEATGDAESAAESKLWNERALAVAPSGRGLSLKTWWMGKAGADDVALIEVALRAYALDPTDQFALHSVGNALWNVSGELNAAAWGHVRTVHPLYLYPTIGEAVMLVRLGRPEEAIDALDQVLALEPGMPAALRARLAPLLALGRIAEAEEAQARIEALPEGILPAEAVASGRWLLRIVGQHEAGDAETASATFDAYMAAIRDGASCDCAMPLPVLARLGRIDDVRQLLEFYVENDEPIPADALLLNPAFAPLYDNSDFQTLLARGRKSFERVAAVLDAAGTRGELPDYLVDPLAKARAAVLR